MKMKFHQIGLIHSPYNQLPGMPIQPSAARGIKGTIELNTDLVPALRDLDGFSHIYLLYYFHLSKHFQLLVAPFLEDVQHGLFATRTPNRPNPIGLSLVKLISIQGSTLHIENVDVIDGTPLIDIKPYIKQMEPINNLQIGWLEKHTSKARNKLSDNRFSLD